MEPLSPRLYDTPEWRTLRARVKAAAVGARVLCPVCLEPIVGRQSLEVDHIQPLREAPELALEISNLRVLHRRCHTRHTHTKDKGYSPAVGDDGYPLDPRHPAGK